LAATLTTGSTNISASSGSITSNTAVLTVSLAAPIGVFAVSGTNQVDVLWSPVTDATSYNIYWGTSAGITTASSKITGATSPYVQTGLTTGNTYYYRVSAVNAAAETLSDEVFTFVYTGGNPTGSFNATGNMTAARIYHKATLLPNGKVLVTGGYNVVGGVAIYPASADLYDPATSSFTTTGNMATGRYSHTATLLPNGKVLITGGRSSTGTLASAELYDPATNSFSTTGSMAAVRMAHTATLLPNGKVLVAGGGDGTGAQAGAAEIYDPATGNFVTTGSMVTARQSHTATLLPNGKVLFTGGYGGGSYLSSAELYDPATGLFSATGSMGAVRCYHNATQLPNGKVLVTGGMNSGVAIASTELYDPVTGSFSATGNMTAARYSLTATLLPNGNVLVSGGNSGTPSYLYLASAELYDPATGLFGATGSMTTGRMYHTATLLSNGKVLATGGSSGTAYLNTSELFQ